MQGVVLDSRDLHLYGLVACFLASKMEDSAYGITMEEILFRAAHGKFSLIDVTTAEKEIYKALEFKLNVETVLDQTFTLLYEALDHVGVSLPGKIQEEDLYDTVNFVARVLVHNYEMTLLPLVWQGHVILQTAL